MKSWIGTHRSEHDFPIKGIARHRSYTNMDLELHFGDVIYVLPEMVMHYLDDAESIGWSWHPPEDLINRIMKGGRVRLGITKIEELTVHQEYIGYLRNGSGKFAGQIVDTKGGDENYDSAQPVRLGRPPEVFLQRLQGLIEQARKDVEYNRENYWAKPRSAIVDLAPVPGYENIVIPVVPPRQMSWDEQIRKLMYEALERLNHGLELNFLPCNYFMLLQMMSFFAIDEHTVAADVDLTFDEVFRAYLSSSKAASKDDIFLILEEELRTIFAGLGVEFDKDCKFPCLKASGKNAALLRHYKARIIPVSETASLEHKLSAITGLKVDQLRISPHAVEIVADHRTFYNGSAFRNFLEKHVMKKDVKYDLRRENEPWSLCCEQKSHFDECVLGDDFRTVIEAEFRRCSLFRLTRDIRHPGEYGLAASLSSIMCPAAAAGKGQTQVPAEADLPLSPRL